MAEKVFNNVRLGLKVDTLENWNKSTLVLKNGEIAIATVAASAGTGLTEPVAMIKIGNEEGKTFSELPWALHAKAADVLAACKTEEALKAFINGVIADAGIASDDALSELSKKVGANETAIGTLNGDATVEGSVAKAIADAIAALKLDEAYDAYGSAAGVLGAETDAAGAATVYGALGAAAEAAGDAAEAAQAAADAVALASEKVASVGATDVSVVVGGTATAPTVGVQISASEDNALSLADDGLKVVIPADAEYTVVKAEVATDGYFATYQLTKDGVAVGATIDIPKDYLVRDASLATVNTADTPYAGAVVGDKYIDFVVNTAADNGTETHLYLPINELVDEYFAGTGLELGADNTFSVKVVAENGLSVDETGIKMGLASGEAAGAMSAAHYTKVEGVENGAQVNVIESVKVNGTVLDIIEKTVDITIPTGALADKDEVGVADLDTELTVLIEGKADAADLADVATSGNINDLIQTEGDELILNCGNSNVVVTA